MTDDKKKIDNGENAEYDDIMIEPDEEVEKGFKGKGEKKLREELKACHKEKQEYLEGWQRAKADLVNFKRTSEEDRKRFARLATEDLVRELLPAMDSFDMAFRDKEAWEKADENWRKGIEYIYAQLLSTLEAHGVTQVNPVGDPFDPNRHDSIGTEAVEDKKQNGTVVAVIQKGYMLHDALIRPPKVHIGEYQD